MPGAARQTWYCSVSLRWKRSWGGGAWTSGGRRFARVPALPPRRARPCWTSSTSSSCSMFPAAATTMFARRVHLVVVARDRVLRDRRDHLGRADHRPPERVVAEDRLGDQVVHELLRRVLVHRDLLEHDLALGVELVEGRREHHVAHHVERRLEVVVGDAGVDDRVLARGGRVQLAAEPVEDLGDLECAEPARSLEEQVLDEVRDARLRRLLVARAGADPVADRGRADVVEPLGDHPLARVELGQDPVLHGRSVVPPATCGRDVALRVDVERRIDAWQRERRGDAEPRGDAAEERCAASAAARA